MAAVLEENGHDVSIIDASALEMTWEDLEKAVSLIFREGVPLK